VKRPKLGACVGFYETDGDWLRFGPNGRTFWAGGEWVSRPITSGPTITTMLNRYFDALTGRLHFGAD
jgi:hypothetical protein